MFQQQQQERREFDDYKQKTGQEFIQYQTSFVLKPNRVIRFDGARVDQGLIDDDVRTDFENFEEFAGELLIEFRDRAKPGRERMDETQNTEELDNESLFDDY